MDFYRKTLTDLANRILSDSGRSEWELSILITGDEEIRSLNREYRSVDSATDVLSFSQLDGDGASQTSFLLGDVVVSWETARRQAEDIGHTELTEIKRLLIHGILHLLGYDHSGSDEAAVEMRELEEKYLGTGDK